MEQLAPPSRIGEYQELLRSTNVGTISRGTDRVDVHSGLQRWDSSDLYDSSSSRDKEVRVLKPEKRRRRMSDESVQNGTSPKLTRRASRPHKRRRIPLTTEVSGWDSEMLSQPLLTFSSRLRADIRELSPTIVDSSSRGSSAMRCRRRRGERESRTWRKSRRAGSSRLIRDFRDYSSTSSSSSGEVSPASRCQGDREERESRTWRKSRRAGSSRLIRDFRDYSSTSSSSSGEVSRASRCQGDREERESRT